MAHFTVAEANAWLEPSKLTLTDINSSLAAQVALQVLSRLSQTFTTVNWTNDATTPALIRAIIAMEYVAWYYDKTYSDDAEANAYAALLRGHAEANITALLGGTAILVEDPTANANASAPAFFPNDASSALPPTADSPSDGGPAFMMGTTF